jgi:hypothetical protein
MGMNVLYCSVIVPAKILPPLYGLRAAVVTGTGAWLNRGTTPYYLAIATGASAIFVGVGTEFSDDL